MPTFALLGGAALYLLAHVAFRLRNVHTLNDGGSAGDRVARVIPALYDVAAIVPLALLSAALVR